MDIPLMSGGIAHTAGDLTVGINPLASQLGHLSMQDRAFLDVFNKQEQQELHGGPREGPVDPRGLLGQLEQAAIGHRGHMVSDEDRRPGHPRHHEIVSELAPEEVRWFYKREVDRDWIPFMGYDSLRLELRYRHIWQTKWGTGAASVAANQVPVQEMPPQQRAPSRGPPVTMDRYRPQHRGAGGARSGSAMSGRAHSLNRAGHYDPRMPMEENEYYENSVTFQVDRYGAPLPPGSAPQRQNYSIRGRHKSYRHYRSADNFADEDREMRLVVRGGVYEVDLAEWKCHSIYWPGEAFDIMRGTWFYDANWQPLPCEQADRIEQEHLLRFRSHKMADYVWDATTGTRLESQIHHTINFTEFHIDWMSPEEVYMHRENTSSQIYRGITASLGFKKPLGQRLFRGYREICQHTDRLADITHLVFVVHGVGQVVDDTTIIRNTNILRDNISALMLKHFPRFHLETGQRVEFFPVEWRSALRLDDGMVQHITPQRIMGLRNLLNSSAMDIMYYTSPLYRMELWQALQEELNRLYEMFVERNPYFEANGGKVSIVAHSLGCVVTYDILTGWTQDVEHSWYNLQTGGPNGTGTPAGGGPDHGKRHHPQHPHNRRYNNMITPAQSGLLFRIENFFCLGSPLSVFLTLRWRDPQNQEYHDHILPRSLCKYLYNIYHPCDPVAYRVEPIFMRFYSQIEPIHLHGPTDPDKIPYAEQPLRHLQAARKEEDKVDNLAGVSVLPVNIANGSINISVGKMAAGIGNQAANLPKLTSMSPSLSLPKMPAVPGLAGMTQGGTAAAGSAAAASASAQAAAATATAAVGDTVGQVGHVAGEVVGGLWGLMKDAAYVTSDTVTNLTTSRVTTTTTATTTGTTTSTITNNGHMQGAHPYPSPTQEVKLPDGQRLAYRMDYILRETGNTYIAAITSHTAYWSNPEVAYFMLTKLHADIEHYNDPPPQRPIDPSIHQGLS